MPDEDFVDRIERISKNWTGESFTPEQTLQEFQMFGQAKRSEILDQLDEAMPDASLGNLRKYVRLTSLRRDMDNVHHALRKAGR
jgi:hypothetical protein